IEYALRLREQGLGAAEIAGRLETKKEDICLLALLGTLEYLKKGGRISPLVAFAGEKLGIKPVVSVVDGEVKLVGKARGSKVGNNLLMKMVQDAGGIDFSMPYATAYSGLEDSVLRKYITDSEILWENQVNEIPVYPIGSTIGTHIGPGAIAVAFFKK
ncbi:MAG: DegV family protein, partial [Lachnospiraceae bacterium]